MSPFTLAARTQRMNASAIREILKLTEGEGVLSLAGGLPAPEAFPLAALQQATELVLRDHGAAALQYSASEGLPALRQWIARRLSARGWAVEAGQVLITNGSQQALDLLGKVMIDPGARVLVEQPTYLGALQALAPYEPAFLPWPSDAEGPGPQGLRDAAVRLAYLVPNFQNPGGQCLSHRRRQALAQALEGSGALLVEDDPYGELWYDTPPPPPIAAIAPSQTVYLGSFSKVLAPGLRVGFVVTPPASQPEAQALHAKLLQAKQACDLHTASLNQRIVMQLLDSGFDLDEHLIGVRERYRKQRDAMDRALRNHLPQSFSWQRPSGGMFFWVTGPEGFDAAAHLATAVAHGVAYVPGGAFHAIGDPVPQRALRLSFVTLSAVQIDEAVRRLAASLRDNAAQPPSAAAALRA